MLTKETKLAAAEVIQIVKNFSKEMLDKIPQDFIQCLNQIADKTHDFKYDKAKVLQEQDIKLETKVLLALIYRDYICDEYEKAEYQDIYNKFLEQIDIKQEVDFKQIFKKEPVEKSNEVIVSSDKNQSLIKRIFNKIRSIFN